MGINILGFLLCGSGQEIHGIELAQESILVFNSTTGGRWDKKETSDKDKVTKSKDGSLKVVGLSFLVGVSQQKDRHDNCHHIPVRKISVKVNLANSSLLP